jgi:hypothetical protein
MPAFVALAPLPRVITLLPLALAESCRPSSHARFPMAVKQVLHACGRGGGWARPHVPHAGREARDAQDQDVARLRADTRCTSPSRGSVRPRSTANFIHWHKLHWQPSMCVRSGLKAAPVTPGVTGARCVLMLIGRERLKVSFHRGGVPNGGKLLRQPTAEPVTCTASLVLRRATASFCPCPPCSVCLCTLA